MNRSFFGPGVASILEAMPDGVLMVEGNGRIAYANRRLSLLFGYAPGELEGHHAELLIPKRFRKAYMKRLERLFAEKGEEPLPPEEEPNYYGLHREGREFPLDVSLNITGIAGTPLAVAGIRDLTLRRERESKIREQEEMLSYQSRQAAMGEMIGMIAHQWRQPITAIGMAAANLDMDVTLDLLTPEKVTEATGEIDRQVHFLSGTIDDFRNFFKPDKKAVTLSVTRVVEDALRVVGKTMENNGIRLVTQLESETPVLLVKNELVQVLLNLIKNAKDVLQERKVKEGWVKVGTRDLAEGAEICVCDNGGGVPEELLSRIFDPYFTTKPVDEGTGLGLYMSRVIVEENMGGKLTVENRDGGAAFSILLAKK